MSFVSAGEDLIQRARAGLYQTGVDIMYVSDTLVPVDTGTLKGSGRVLEPEEVGAGRVVCVIGYGYGEEINPKTDERAIQYAIPVHERLDVRHEPPTQAKFLETAALAYEPFFEATMVTWMKTREWTAPGSREIADIVRGPSTAIGSL